MSTKILNVDQIRIDGDTQNRKSVSEDTVADYADVWSAAEPTDKPFPPIDVFHDGSDYWCADGFHRLLGAIKAKRSSIQCKVRKGGSRDAFLFGCHANIEHGLRRTRADLRHAVERLLQDKEWGKLSQMKIAALAGCTRQYVSQVKIELFPPVREATTNTSAEVAIKNSTASDGSHDSGTQGGEDSGGGDGTDGAPPAAGKAPTDECPNCRGKNWDEDGDSWACRKCSHPYGEPAEGKEPDKPKAKDSALAKFLEVWSAADALGRIAIEAWWRDYLSDVDAKTVKPRKRGGFTPPTLEDVKEYCASRGKGVNAQQWYDHYTANGWKVGRNSMKDWKAAVRTWEGKTFSQESLAKTKARASRAMEYSE